MDFYLGIFENNKNNKKIIAMYIIKVKQIYRNNNYIIVVKSNFE